MGANLLLRCGLYCRQCLVVGTSAGHIAADAAGVTALECGEGI
jgi:hypothetical protein